MSLDGEKCKQIRFHENIIMRFLCIFYCFKNCPKKRGTVYLPDISLNIEQAATTDAQFILLLSKVRGALTQIGRRTTSKLTRPKVDADEDVKLAKQFCDFVSVCSTVV